MIGDKADIAARLKSYLPDWFGAGPTPILDSLLGGTATALAQAYSFYAYAKSQTRILTATGMWLDLVAADYFGRDIVRKPGQGDPSFRAYIIASLLRPRATRPSMQALLFAVTGQQPIIFEPQRPLDTGACNAPLSPGYCGVARCGSIAVPFTCFITAYRPVEVGGLAGAMFCGAPTGGMGATSGKSYAGSLTLETVTIDDADIYAAINANKVAGTICWVGLTARPVQAIDGPELDFSKSGNSQYLGAL